ncbi:hypothetical protein ALC57_17560 [Trachymyrmex cornetzi]|uniref:Uncharacterized protein n=1 Tax=Trachymyrmex cornetzi TaxID=471704 RepID=A0A195DBW0_9HYME|nr:hypothetical protein ALC57_17560 [Trachymyrmex cornetzi]
MAGRGGSSSWPRLRFPGALVVRAVMPRKLYDTPCVILARGNLDTCLRSPELLDCTVKCDGDENENDHDDDNDNDDDDHDDKRRFVGARWRLRFQPQHDASPLLSPEAKRHPELVPLTESRSREKRRREKTRRCALDEKEVTEGESPRMLLQYTSPFYPLSFSYSTHYKSKRQPSGSQELRVVADVGIRNGGIAEPAVRYTTSDYQPNSGLPLPFSCTGGAQAKSIARDPAVIPYGKDQRRAACSLSISLTLQKRRNERERERGKHDLKEEKPKRDIVTLPEG